VSVASRSFRDPRSAASDAPKPRQHSAGEAHRHWLPPGIWWLVGALAVLFSWGPNLELLVLSLGVLVIGSALCWRPGEPGVILFMFGFSWLQASIGIFAANAASKSIDETAVLSNADMAGATALTLLGLLVLFGCVRLATRAPMTNLAALAREQAAAVAPSRLALMYLTAFLTALALTYASSISEGIRQPLLAFANVKWAAFVIVAYAAFVQGGPARNLFLLIFAVEFVLSLGGYFSSFQEVFVYTFIAAISSSGRLTTARIAVLSLLVGAAIVLGVVWTVIKVDYRAYLNGGAGQQIITVSWTERMAKLGDMAATVNGEQLLDGVNDLVSRVTYVEFFGAAINFVPAVKPHTSGEIWTAALLHPVTPRFLFPNKPILDDSQQTREYTGVEVAGWAQGTQISIGYFGESYIDFGPIGMMLPLAVYGFAAGAMYRSILTFRRFRGLIGAALTVPVLMGGSQIGVSTEKLVGSLVVTYLAVFLLCHFMSGPIRMQVFGRETKAE
jgi:hypothetical protein